MRSYAIISPMFWTRGSGKRLRGDAAAQVVALYLMSCPMATMVGIFPLSLATLAHETGLTFEGASKGLRRCTEEGIAFYDEEDELCWVPALAKHQIGERLGLGKTGKPDKRIAGVERALKPFKGHRFYNEFLDRYAGAYMLELKKEEAPSKPLGRGHVLVPDLVPVPDPEKGVQGGPPRERDPDDRFKLPPNWDPGTSVYLGTTIPDWAHQPLLERFRSYHCNAGKLRTAADWRNSYASWASREWQTKRPEKPEDAGQPEATPVVDPARQARVDRAFEREREKRKVMFAATQAAEPVRDLAELTKGIGR